MRFTVSWTYMLDKGYMKHRNNFGGETLRQRQTEEQIRGVQSVHKSSDSHTDSSIFKTSDSDSSIFKTPTPTPS
jgi:hypothetical protein